VHLEHLECAEIVLCSVSFAAAGADPDVCALKE
jgi:hypothetical protein